MSHFSTLVLVEAKSRTKGKALTPEQLEREVERRLAPYDENHSVPNYKEKCGCVGRAAKRSAHEVVEGEDPLDGYRERFKAAHPIPEGRNEFSLGRKERFERDQAWMEFIKPYVERVERHEKANVMYNQPDPDCEDCKGTGQRDTSYNPKSKWDWWAIGGRWTGDLSGYDPHSDPDNRIVCNWCHGTGKRDDALGRDARAKDPTYTCNACGGTGKELKFPTEWKNIGNVAPVKDVIPLVEAEQFVPFAVVTPDGEWHEAARMGWWGMTSEDKEPDAWKNQVVELLRKNETAVAVLVDCHI